MNFFLKENFFTYYLQHLHLYKKSSIFRSKNHQKFIFFLILDHLHEFITIQQGNATRCSKKARRFIYFFQLGCTSENFSFLLSFFRRPLPVAGAKKRWRPMESILSPPTLYSRKLGSSAVCGTEEHSRMPCAHCQTTHHPEHPSLFPPFSTRFVSVGVRQTPVSNSVIYLAYVCQRNPLSLLEDTGTILELMPPNLPFLFIALYREARDEINLR